MNAEKTMDAADILTPQELAKRLKVPLSWIYEKSRNRGQYNGAPLPCLRCGKYLRFDWNAVVAWMRSGAGDVSGNGSGLRSVSVPGVRH